MGSSPVGSARKGKAGHTACLSFFRHSTGTNPSANGRGSTPHRDSSPQDESRNLDNAKSDTACRMVGGLREQANSSGINSAKKFPLWVRTLGFFLFANNYKILGEAENCLPADRRPTGFSTDLLVACHVFQIGIAK